ESGKHSSTLPAAQDLRSQQKSKKPKQPKYGTMLPKKSPKREPAEPEVVTTTTNPLLGDPEMRKRASRRLSETDLSQPPDALSLLLPSHGHTPRPPPQSPRGRRGSFNLIASSPPPADEKVTINPLHTSKSFSGPQMLAAL